MRTPSPPDYLDADAVKFWKDNIKKLINSGRYEKYFYDSFALLCQNYSRLKNYEIDTKDNQSRLFFVALNKIVIASLKEFCLTPHSTKSHLLPKKKEAPPPPPPPKDEFGI